MSHKLMLVDDVSKCFWQHSFVSVNVSVCEQLCVLACTWITSITSQPKLYCRNYSLLLANGHWSYFYSPLLYTHRTLTSVAHHITKEHGDHFACSSTMGRLLVIDPRTNESYHRTTSLIFCALQNWCTDWVKRANAENVSFSNANLYWRLWCFGIWLAKNSPPPPLPPPKKKLKKWERVLWSGKLFTWYFISWFPKITN